TGDAIILQSTGNFDNEAGAGAFTTGAGGRYLVFLHDPSNVVTRGGLTAGNFYGQSYNNPVTTPSSSFGSRFVFETQPTLTVTANSFALTYGAATPTLTYGVTGVVNGDPQAEAYTGTPNLSTGYVSGSPVSGSPYTITAAQGGLTSPIGYLFNFVNGQ